MTDQILKSLILRVSYGEVFSNGRYCLAALLAQWPIKFKKRVLYRGVAHIECIRRLDFNE